MLQPRESRLLWRRQKRRHNMEGLCCSKIYSTLVVIGCITLLPQGLTQHNDDVYIVKPTPALRLGKEATEETPKQLHHFDSGQDDSNGDTLFQHKIAALKTSYGTSNVESNNNEQNQNDVIDEARYNLATRIMSNGVEVIIASDKTKTPDYMAPDISNSQLQYNRPMTLAASTIKNQMMILLFPSSPTATDNGFVAGQSIQQLNYNLSFHTNHFITKTCLTTYTYRTTYVQNGRTTVESQEKVISNIATEERNYPKITPTQTIGVTLTKTPELAVGIFPTTYSYFNTFKDNSDKLQVITSEYTVVNTITGPNDYVAYLQPTAKATPALKTNTYYSEVTISQMIKSKMHTEKRNLTQVVVTKSYTPAQSTSVLTSYYAYDDSGLESTNAKLHLLTTSVAPSGGEEGEKGAELLNQDKTQMLDDIHIYATKKFLTTFTYYTTTVLNSYLADKSTIELAALPTMSTVFNYYTRVIENVITDSVAASLLPSELLAKMKIELRRQKLNQRQRLIVTTATLKDGHTVKISAMEIYKGNMASDLSSIAATSSADLLQHSQQQLAADHYLGQEHNGPNDIFHELQVLPNSSIENVKRPFKQEIEAEEEAEEEEEMEMEETEHNGFASLPSEQVITVVDAPTKQTSHTNQSIAINDKPSTSATNQLIQRLTALKPMFNAMADLLQNNFGVTRGDTIKPIKNIESKQAANKNINSSATTTNTNTITDTKHPIYIPVQEKSPIRHNPYEISNYTEFIPQSLHIKPPLLINDENNFELSEMGRLNIKAKHTSIIPLSTLTAPRQEQPLHNGGIYIRPGEIITANSDVIVGKPNGIEYVQIPNQLHIERNSSKAYSLDNRQFQVTYYHNKVQHPYKKKTSSSIAPKPQHIPIANNGKTSNPTYGLRPPNDKHFNKNILKPPPPPPPPSPTIQSPIPIHSPQGLSLMLKAPEKPTTRKRIKQQHHTTTNVQVSSEASSPLHLQSPPALSSTSIFKTPEFPPAPGVTANLYNFNKELKNNEILEIQKMPQIFSANLKANSRPSSNTNGEPAVKANFYPSYTKPNLETISSTWLNGQEPHTPGTATVEHLPTFGANSNWQNGQEPQIEISTAASYIYVDQKPNVGVSDRNTQIENALTGSSLVWNIQHGHQGHNQPQAHPHTHSQSQSQISNPFSSHVIQEKYKNSALNAKPNKITSTNLADMATYLKEGRLPTRKPLPHNKKINPNDQHNNYYFNESVTTKNHQNVSLEQHIFSHTVDVNVPPLTFNREDHDYPQQTATAVRGQIPPPTVKELKTQGENVYKYMPLITIPAHEKKVQVHVTPLNSLSALTRPLVGPNEPSWNSELANRKISLPNGNFKVFTSDQDQKTVATNNILNINSKAETTANWKQQRREEHLPNPSHHLNKKSQTSSTTTKPADTVIYNTEEKKSKKTGQPNRKHHPTIVSAWESHILPRVTTAKPSTQTPEKLKNPSEIDLKNEEQQIQMMADPSSSKEQNRATRVSIQKVKVNNFGNKLNKIAATTNAFKAPTVTSEEPTAEDINEIMNSNNKTDENIEVTRLASHGEPFRKVSYKTEQQDKNNQTKTAAIFVVPGEAFKTSTHKNTLRTDQPPAKKIPLTESSVLGQEEVFVTRNTGKPAHHSQGISAEIPLSTASKPAQMPNAKSSNEKGSNATTETVFGLQPPPLKQPTNAGSGSASKTASTNYSLLNHSHEVTRKRQPNKANRIALNTTREMITDQVKSGFRITDMDEQNPIQSPHENFSSPNVAAIELVNNSEVAKAQNNTAQATNVNASDLEYESLKLPNLQPSESYEGKISTTTTSPLASAILTLTTTTTTIKRIILPTKYITNKRIYTITTTASLPLQLHLQPSAPTAFFSTVETTTEVTTLFLTHTKINTIIDTVTSVKTLEPVTITTTTTLKPSSSESRPTKLSSTSIEQRLPDMMTRQFSQTSNDDDANTLEIDQELAYLPYPTVEVVSTNISQDTTDLLNPKENSIFIIMTNNKSKKNTAFTQPDRGSSPELPADHIDETNEVVIEYDNGITFDDIPVRDEEPEQIVNGKSVSSSAFVNNVASVKGSSSDGHIILGGVLIATPPKFPTRHLNTNESSNVGCHPKCRVSRNEQCGLVDSYWSCFCRPGFARMFPDRPCKPTYTYDLLMHAERIGNYTLQYVNELKNNKTDHYKQLSQLVNNALDRMIMQSDFRDAYHGVEVTQYTDGHKNQHGIFINVLLQLSDNSNEKRLEEVLKKNLRLSNYSIGGTDLYTNKAGVDALSIKDFNECMSRKLHDCSESAHCFNLPGTYTCSCIEGFADLSDNPIYPGRICSSEEIGCEMCHYHGKCSTLVASVNDVNYCECFPWYAGSKCQVNLKILLIVLLGIGTLLFILLLFCILITCTKRRNHLQHTALAPSTVTSSSEGLQKSSRLAANMVISTIGLRSSLRGGVSLKNNKRQKLIKIEKRSMIKDSSSETSQNSLPYVLKNRESIAGSCNKKKSCLLKHSKTHGNCSSQGNAMEQYSMSIPSSIQIENESELNTVIMEPSSFKGINQQTDHHQNLLENATEYEGHYCEQSDRSLTVMIPRAKYHSSVLPQTQLMHHQLTMERLYKTAKSEIKSINADKDADLKRYYKKNPSNTREMMDEGKRTEIPTNPGALISAGFEVSAIVRDNTTFVNSGEQHNDLVRFDAMPNYTIVNTSDPATSLDSNSDQKHLLNEERQPYEYTTNKNKNPPTNESDYNVYKCEKDLIETMDEWLGNVKRNELSAEARSFDETTIRASTKPLHISTDGTRTQQDSNAGTQTHDELNTMAERDLGSTFLLPHTHLYKPDRQESELSGFDSF